MADGAPIAAARHQDASISLPREADGTLSAALNARELCGRVAKSGWVLCQTKRGVSASIWAAEASIRRTRVWSRPDHSCKCFMKGLERSRSNMKSFTLRPGEFVDRGGSNNNIFNQQEHFSAWASPDVSFLTHVRTETVRLAWTWPFLARMSDGLLLGRGDIDRELCAPTSIYSHPFVSKLTWAK